MSNPITIEPAQLLKEKEVAQRLNLKVSTLRRWRWSGDGPIFCKIGAAVRYDPADIQDFIEANRKASTSQSDVAA